MFVESGLVFGYCVRFDSLKVQQGIILSLKFGSGLEVEFDTV